MEFKIKMNRMEFQSFCMLVNSCMTMTQMDIEMDDDKSSGAVAERVYRRDVLVELVMKLARKAMDLKAKNRIGLNSAESYVIFKMFSGYPLSSIAGLELSVLLQVQEALNRHYLNKESEIKSAMNYELLQN